MADVFQLIVDILKINQQTISQYANVAPLEQLFYLFIFPTLFIIVLVYIVGTHWIRHRGLGILVSMALYAFIVFQGYYSFFVMLSNFWLFGLMFLGFLWLIFRPKEGRGGQAKAIDGGKGSMFKIRRAIENQLGFSLNPLTNVEAITDVKRAIEETKGKMKKVQGLFDKEKDAEKKQFLLDQLGQLEQQLAQLEYELKHPSRRRKYT